MSTPPSEGHAEAAATPGPAPGTLRVSDADRERTAEALRRHAGDGRLDATELEARLDAAYGATTAAELDRLAVDLPELDPVGALAPREQARAEVRRQVLQQAGGALGVSLLCVVIWAVGTAASGYFWPVWVLLGTGLGVVASAWRGLGPGGDPEAELARRAERERERRGYGHGSAHRGLGAGPARRP